MMLHVISNQRPRAGPGRCSMAMKVSKVDVWAAGIKDRPGALADKLSALAAAKANLAFVIARRTSKAPGGVVFVTPLKGARQLAAARKAGFKRTGSLHSLRVDGPDRSGIGAKMTAALAEAGINLRGLSAAAIGKQFAAYFAFDKVADAARAARLLKKV